MYYSKWYTHVINFAFTHVVNLLRKPGRCGALKKYREMPINIYIEDSVEKLEWLCYEAWDLPTQIDALETWLMDKGKTLEPSKYVADIGFDIRKDATGGGGVLNSESMAIMGKIGMDVYFSEYPSVSQEDEV